MQARNLASVWNRKILFMVAVPYALLGVFGFLIYRGVKRNEEFRRQHHWADAHRPPPGLEDRS